jgi:AbiV family abortive infection protein
VGAVLTFSQLRDGYVKTTDNALGLLQASAALVVEHAVVALGAAELGQEELGKSLSLLAAFSLPQDSKAWDWLWQGWKSHQLKAHRAFLHELVHPVRLETPLPNGSSLDGGPLRPRMQDEKEFSVYVNFDPKTGHFLAPADAVSAPEIQNRIATLTCLMVTAYQIRYALESFHDIEFAHRAFGGIAFRICTEELYSADMPQIIEAFAARSVRHERLVDSLRAALAAGTNVIKTFAAAARPPDSTVTG